MDIHPPHAIRSVKDFLLQLLTITIGILIALALDGVVQWTHHRELVHEAESNLTMEVKENQAEVNKGLQGLRASQQQLREMIGVIRQLQQNRGAPMHSFSFSWTLDELHATSWNTASDGCNRVHGLWRGEALHASVRFAAAIRYGSEQSIRLHYVRV